MRITGQNAQPPAVPNPAARGAARKAATPDGEVPAVPGESPAVAEEPKAHGLVRAAEQSNRSDVAALRQWINHPDLRDSLDVPDLTAGHHGKGFDRAVAAYQAAGPPVPPSDPVVTDPVVPDPVVPDPVVPDPVVPDPVVPDPVVPDPGGGVDETLLELLPVVEDEPLP